MLNLADSRQWLRQVLAAGFIVCRFDLDKNFSELVGCPAFDNGSNLSLSVDDHNIDTDSSLEYFIS